MGIMDRIFRATPPAQQGTMPIQNPVNPAGTAAQPSGTSEPTTPLDQFKDLWQPTVVKPEDDPFSKPLLTHDAAKFNEAVGKMNFADGITPEQLTKAMQDPAALLQVLNTVGQKAFSAATNLTTNIVEGAAKTNNDRMNQAIPKKIRETQISTTRSENPVLNHPSTAPMLDMAKRQLMAQHPDMTPAQVQAQAEQMMSTFADQFVGNRDATSKGNAPDPEDFSSWG